MQTEELIACAKEFFSYYKQEIGKAAKQGKKAVAVSFHDIAAHSHELAEHLLAFPEEALQILEIALEETGLISNVRVRLTDLPSSQSIEIRNIRAKHLNQLIYVEGLIRQASVVRPQVVNAKFECPSCGSILTVLQIDKTFHEPKRCSCGRKGLFKLIEKEMVDVQHLAVEESTESLIGSEQPRRMNIFLKEDLVEPKMEERTTPGSKVAVIGVLKEVPIPLRTGQVSTRFDLVIEANNILPLEETFESLEITEEDERQIMELASDPRLYEKLVKSTAPSVYGHEKIKEALVLQLFGGVKRKRLDTKTFCRGDMHILLVGDPGVAKSVMLKFITGIAPKARYTSGRATSGAGITATIVRDEFLRGWSLEAGAMVLCNKGLLAIDELEDMAEEDRSAMHEAMEQQTISISKANVQATLKAETSVLAAANPKFGRFVLEETIPKQINIDPTLLNRFDLIFVMLDIPERGTDGAIALKVLNERREEKNREENKEDKDIIEAALFKKYIAYSKQKIFPELTEQAVEEIKNFYVALRNISLENKPIPITARQLEALARLAEANAKARLSKKVTKEDARKAIELMKYCMQQVGIDETGHYDIDRIVIGISTSQRGKIIAVRDAIGTLEKRIGKLIPFEELERELEEKIDKEKIEEIIEELIKAGDIFRPKRGFIQKI